jgi:dihydrofolate reductase
MATTRRIVMFNRMSADGYFAAKDGDLSWATPDDQLDREAAESMAEADTMLFGRKTYEAFEGFWPNVLGDSETAPDPHDQGRRTSALRDIATWIDDSQKLVFSSTRKQVTWRNSRLYAQLDPREIERLKRQPGKQIMVFGSGSLVTQLTRHGLIDEFQFVVCPLILGDGQPMIKELGAVAQLRLLEAKPYPSGAVKLRYAPRNA